MLNCLLTFDFDSTLEFLSACGLKKANLQPIPYLVRCEVINFTRRNFS